MKGKRREEKREKKKWEKGKRTIRGEKRKASQE